MITPAYRYTRIGVAVLTLLYFLYFLYTMPGGDDWGYAGLIGGENPELEAWYRLPSAWFGHWIGGNGRLANFVLTPLMLLPDCLRAMLCALFVGAFYYLVVVCARALNNGLVAAFLCACVCFVLPWWDSFNLFACQTNYVWASVGILACVYIIIYTPRIPLWLSMLICALGASGHEAATIGAGVGVVVWLAINRQCLTRRRIWLIISACAGALLPLGSPGIWLRAAEDSVPDDTLWLLIFKNISPTIILCIALTTGLILKTTRQRVIDLLRSPAMIYIIGALICGFISVWSGIVGRSGWFSIVFAIVALGMWLNEYRPRTRPFVIVVIWLVTIGQTAFATYWQTRLYSECVDVKEQYLRSREGRAYLDYTRYSDIPWLTLGKVRGVLQPQEVYLRFSFARYHRRDKKLPTVLPVETLNISTVPSILKNGDIVVREIPEPILYIADGYGDTLLATRAESGDILVAQQLDSLWVLSALNLAPGERPIFTEYGN